MKTTHILIVDDSQIHLEGLKLLLRPYEDFVIIGEANNPTEAMTQINEIMPDVAILDISMEKELDGIELAREIKAQHSEVKIIFLTHYKETRYLVNALKTGANAYLPKDLNPQELIHAIRAVCEGQGIYLGETIPFENLLNAFGSEENLQKNKLNDLTDREIEIIQLLGKGYSTKELASKLNIEINTVESHKERIKEKLNVKTVIQIVMTALKRGIISLDS